jgi:hypothetical protein
MKALLMGIAVVVCARPVLAQSTCDFQAYAVTGEEVLIRSAPGGEAVGVAPETRPDGEDWVFGAEFRITGMQDGWAMVTEVTDWNRTAVLPDGWIDGAQVRFGLQTGKVFAEPDAGSEVVWAGDAMPFAEGLHDCAGEWALVTARVGEDAPVRGWARGACGIQETSCDGVQGD